MYRLTERRKAKADPILEKYNAQLHADGAISAMAFEKELCACWNVGYQSLKDIIKDLSKLDEYVYLAAYYMEHSNSGVGVVCEFQPVLAKLYGIKWYHGPDMKTAQKAFWAKMKTDN
jgi:hypothetical protein